MESLAQVVQSDVESHKRFFHAMLDRGVYMAPSQFEAGFISLAHTQAEVDQTVATAESALKELR